MKEALNSACCDLTHNGFVVQSEINHNNYAPVHQTGCELIRSFSGQSCCVMLDQCPSFDSAILSLMVSWVRYAQSVSVKLTYAGCPDSLRRLVTLSGIDTCLEWE